MAMMHVKVTRQTGMTCRQHGIVRIVKISMNVIFWMYQGKQQGELAPTLVEDVYCSCGLLWLIMVYPLVKIMVAFQQPARLFFHPISFISILGDDKMMEVVRILQLFL